MSIILRTSVPIKYKNIHDMFVTTKQNRTVTIKSFNDLSLFDSTKSAIATVERLGLGMSSQSASDIQSIKQEQE